MRQIDIKPLCILYFVYFLFSCAQPPFEPDIPMPTPRRQLFDKMEKSAGYTVAEFVKNIQEDDPLAVSTLYVRPYCSMEHPLNKLSIEYCKRFMSIIGKYLQQPFFEGGLKAWSPCAKTPFVLDHVDTVGEFDYKLEIVLTLDEVNRTVNVEISCTKKDGSNVNGFPVYDHFRLESQAWSYAAGLHRGERKYCTEKKEEEKTSSYEKRADPSETETEEYKLLQAGMSRVDAGRYTVSREYMPWFYHPDDDEIVIDLPFRIMNCEVTVKAFQQFYEDIGRSGNKPVKYEDEKYGSDNCPKAYVTWAEANEYAKWMSRRTGMTFRLPTRKQWMAACIALGQKPYDAEVKDYRLDFAELGCYCDGAVPGNLLGNLREWSSDACNNGNAHYTLGEDFNTKRYNIETRRSGDWTQVCYGDEEIFHTHGFRLVELPE